MSEVGKGSKRVVHETFIVEYQQEKFVGLWNSKITGDEKSDAIRILDTRRVPENVSIEDLSALFENGELPEGFVQEESSIRYLVSQQGIAKVQEELNITRPTHDVDVAAQVLDKVWAGEYVGQLDDSTGFHLENLGNCLNLINEGCYCNNYNCYCDTYELFWRIENKKIAGLDGTKIVTFDAQEQRYKELEEQTGHSRINFGPNDGWYCISCFQSGEKGKFIASETPCKASEAA